MLCRVCRKKLFLEDSAKVKEIRFRVPDYLQDDFYRAVPAGDRSRVLRDLLEKYLASQPKQDDLFRDCRAD